MAEVLEIKDSAELEKQIADGGVTAVDFWASWCGPCTALAPVVGRLAEAYGGKVLFCKVNVDGQRALAEKYGIRSIPCVILFNHGAEAERLVGLKTETVYKTALERLLAP